MYAYAAIIIIIIIELLLNIAHYESVETTHTQRERVSVFVVEQGSVATTSWTWEEGGPSLAARYSAS